MFRKFFTLLISRLLIEDFNSKYIKTKWCNQNGELFSKILLHLAEIHYPQVYGFEIYAFKYISCKSSKIMGTSKAIIIYLFKLE